MNNKSVFFKSHFFFYALVVFLAGCNTGEDQIPPSATVEISPESVDWEILINDDGTCTYDPFHFQDTLFTIRVLDGESRPIGDAELIIGLELADNTYSLQYPHFLELYDDKNGDFIADEDEYVSRDDDPLHFTRTDKYNGYKTIIVRTNLSCVYGGTVSVVANGATARAEIDVEEGN